MSTPLLAVAVAFVVILSYVLAVIVAICTGRGR